MKRKLPGKNLNDNREETVAGMAELLGLELDDPLLARLMAEKIFDDSAAKHERLTKRVQQLWDDLGPRKFRLLLAACCRHALHDRFQGGFKTELAFAFDVLEEFADTGKGKTALQDVWQTSKSRWNIRDFYDLRALHKALSPSEPQAALIPSVDAIREVYKLTDEQAWQQLERFRSDLISPSPVERDFASSWRTPTIVDLARSMYEARDFTQMPRLAELLTQARCKHKAVLDHCHDARGTHIRGCWVIDAILGDWISNRPSTTKERRKKPAKNSRLAQVGKAARDQIAKIIEERDGNLSLHEFLKKYWDWYAPWRSPFADDKKIAQEQAARQDELAKLHSDWSPEQIDTTIRLQQITMGLKDVAIARRVALDDPGELGRGLAVLNRFYQLSTTWQKPPVLEISASGDVELARRLVQGQSYGHKAIVLAEDLHMDVIYGMLQRNSDCVGRLVSQSALRKQVRPWLEGIYIALHGAWENGPDDVSRGLQMHMNGLNKMQQKDELSGAVNLTVHGLYRLLQWVSPDLVSQFDATQPFPWDAEFHAWTQDHPEPLAELDLTDISPVLHDFIVLGKIPEWLVPAAEPLYEIVLLGGDPKSEELLNVIEECSGGTGNLKSAKALLAHAPWPLRWNFRKQDKHYLDAYRQRIEQFGGQAEVREMEPRNFRFFVPSQVG